MTGLFGFCRYITNEIFITKKWFVLNYSVNYARVFICESIATKYNRIHRHADTIHQQFRRKFGNLVRIHLTSSSSLRHPAIIRTLPLIEKGMIGASSLKLERVLTRLQFPHVDVSCQYGFPVFLLCWFGSFGDSCWFLDSQLFS